jgi:hypothetical protein
MEEEHIYGPGELIFMVMPANEDMEIATVAFTTKECWKEEHCQSDDLGGHNISNKILESCGVCSGELQESVFEILEGFSVDQVKEKLLAAGFTEDPEFNKFMTQN